MDGLAREQGDALRVERVSAVTPDARAYLKGADLGGHGVEVFDGMGRRVWHSTAHDLDLDGLRAAIHAVAVSGR